MYRVVKILIVLMLAGIGAQAQSFPNTDSLRRYIDKYIRNSAIDAFTNLRLNTALKGTIGKLDEVAASVVGGVRTVDSLWKPNDSTFAYRIHGSTYYLTDRGTGGGGGGGSITIDLVPTDGSGNAVSSNGVFDALATKASTTHTHNASTDLTSGLVPAARIGAGTVGLDKLAATGTPGSTNFLRGDGSWAVPPGATYSATAPLVLSGSAFSIPLATNSVSGYLSSADRTAFAAKLGGGDTLSLSTRINYAYIKLLQLSDSTIGFQKGDGSIDTLQISGITGGSSGGGGSSGSVTTVSVSNLSPLFTTIVTNSNTTPAVSFTLSNAAAYSILGRAAGTGLPSYLTALDSNWIPTLHSQAYYDARYAAIGSSGSVAWSAITGKPTTLGGYGITDAQPLDADLTQIAAISPANDDIIQRKAGAWTNRTPAQFKADLGLVKGDVGLGNVDNTSDVNKPVSTAQSASIATKQNTLVSGTSIKTINGTSILGSGDLVVAGSGGQTSSQVAAQIHDSLGNPKILRNQPGVGDSVFVFNGDSILATRHPTVESGANITVNKVGNSYIPNFTGSAYTGERIANFNTNYTVTLSIGFIQNLGFFGTTSGRVITLPTGSQYDGLTLIIYNYASISVSTSIPYYWPDGSTSSSGIATGVTIKLVYSFSANKYFIYMQAHI